MPGPWRAFLEHAHRHVPGFLDHCERRIPWARYDLVGFTTSMNQNTAALALARRVKARAPGARVVLGGAACAGEMGPALQRAYRFVDVVVRGEAEPVVPALVAALFDGGRLDRTPSISYWESGRQVRTPPAPSIADLDGQPLPDHGDYFAHLRRSRLALTVRPRVPFEASRGCWCGAKHQCTFCGLNALELAYRRKSPDRVAAELSACRRAYGVRSFVAVDNVLDWRAHQALLPGLPRVGDLDLFFEVKVGMSREHARQLAQAGVRTVQPGIESLSTPILRLMRKGTTALQNLRFLRWCEEFGITPLWNVLYGFPREPGGEYDRMASAMVAFRHLRPPLGAVRRDLQRFSPYHARPEAYGLRRLGPRPLLADIYRVSPDLLAQIAYSFDYEYADGAAPCRDRTRFFTAVTEWQRAYRPGLLTWRTDGRVVVVHDGRDGASGRRLVLDPGTALVFRSCEGARTVGALAGSLRRRAPADYVRAGGADGIARRLRALVEAALVYEEGGRYLSLGVPVDPHAWVLDGAGCED